MSRAGARRPADRRDRDYLDRAISRAQKRMADAARELARVRRLALPAVLTRVVTGQPAALAPAGTAATGGDSGA